MWRIRSSDSIWKSFDWTLRLDWTWRLNSAKLQFKFWLWNLNIWIWFENVFEDYRVVLFLVPCIFKMFSNLRNIFIHTFSNPSENFNLKLSKNSSILDTKKTEVSFYLKRLNMWMILPFSVPSVKLLNSAVIFSNLEVNLTCLFTLTLSW